MSEDLKKAISQAQIIAGEQRVIKHLQESGILKTEPPADEEALWNEVIAIVATFDIMKNTRPGDAESINYFKKKATDELKSKFQLTKKQ